MQRIMPVIYPAALVVWLAFLLFVPIHLDNMRLHLTITGLAGMLGGVWLSRKLPG